MALVAFLNVEGAFDNTSYNSIDKAARERGIDPNITKWISNMLKCRVVKSHLGSNSLKIRTTRGCPLAGVLSPLLWCLIMDDLIKKLEDAGFEVIGYADDIAIIVRGKDDSTISSRMQEALNMIWNWCSGENLTINPNKTVLIPFTRRRKHEVKPPTINGIEINFSSETKYLGVILDEKLSWKLHVEGMKAKAINSLMAC